MLIPNQSNATYNAMMPTEGSTPGSIASNTVNTEILSYAITKTINCDKSMVKEGETAHTTVTVTNNSTAKLIYTFISNLKPEGATFVPGSVKVNGVAQPNRDMISGFYLPNLNPGESLIVEYDIKVDNPATVTTITDYSEFQYSVNDPARGKTVTFAENTDTITLNVVSAKLSVVKSVDKLFATKGEVLTYTVTFTNEGNVDINDIYFTDNIPSGTTFVEKSVFINGTNVPAYTPEVGYSLANLTPKQSATTSFKVTVN
mgnify:FL=1